MQNSYENYEYELFQLVKNFIDYADSLVNRGIIDKKQYKQITSSKLEFLNSAKKNITNSLN